MNSKDGGKPRYFYDPPDHPMSGLLRTVLEDDGRRAHGRRDASAKAFSLTLLSVEEAREQHPDLWETAQAGLPNLLSDQIAFVVSLVVGTCDWCYASDGDCRCWDDS